MRPWRDVISVGAFKSIMGNATTTQFSKVQALKAKVSSQAVTPESSLRNILDHLVAYHDVRKTALETIEERRTKLAELSALAAQHLQTFKIDLQQAEQRALTGQKWVVNNQDKATKSPYTGHHESGTPQKESLDRNLLSLQRRSLRKRKYLKQLREYYTTGNGQNFLQSILAPVNNDNDTVELHTGVRAEALDFAHRPIEVHFNQGKVVVDDEMRGNHNGIAMAFADWVNNIGNQSVPFFLWLEKQPLCLADDKSLISSTVSVNYVQADTGVVPAAFARLALVSFNGPNAMMQALATPSSLPQIADTSAYTSALAKGGNGVAAYVWTQARELFINDHSEGSFHHSSFVSGQRVRCAGMITFKQGKVTLITNTSGHYRPQEIHLRNFVKYLVQRHVIQATTQIKVASGGYNGPYSQSLFWT